MGGEAMSMAHDGSDLVPVDLPRGIRAVAFDLDNTLARSKQPMSEAMGRSLSGLTALTTVAVITGGRLGLVRHQVLDVLGPSTNRSAMVLMPTSGTRCYRWDGSSWRCLYSYDLSPEDRAAAAESLERHAREQGIWFEDVWGDRIEDRGSQVTFSALGQLAPSSAKESWDPTNVLKNRLAEAVAADLPHLEVRSGGSTSVDVSLKGIDKAYAVRRLADLLRIDVGSIVFVGDRMDPDGNDYPVIAAGVFAVRVSGPDQTLRVCDVLASRLREPASLGAPVVPAL